jgi:Carboxypeptidase regulatory-like domain/TonB dependent receptor
MIARVDPPIEKQSRYSMMPSATAICGNASSSGKIWLSILYGLLLIAFIHIGAPRALGQAEQGTITGTVNDLSGAVIAGAKVTATEVSMQTVSTTVTNTHGYYTIPYLAPGTYNISVEAQGFDTSVVSGVHLTVNLTTNVNLTLKLGAVSQKVTVQANAIQLETENSELGGTVSRQQILELPQMGRNAYSLTALQPAVLPEETSPSPIQAEINGGMANTSNVLLDGGTQVNSSTGDIALTPPSESVGELKLITNNFSAEYGMSGGGILTATTLSGTNVFRGSAYEYLQNAMFNANGWYRNYVGLPRAPVHNNLYGFSIGGPVRIPHIYNGKNKTFFFVNLEWNPSTRPDAITASVPTPAMRTGDFSGLVDESGNPIKIYDPNTTALVSGTTNTWTRSQFSCNGVLNVICPDRLSPIAQLVDSYYPLPNNPGIQGIYNNYIASPTRTTVQDNFLARVDQNFGDNNKAFVRIGRVSSDASTPTVTLAFPQAGGNGDPGIFLNTSWTGAVSDTWTIHPNLLAEFRGNFVRSLNQTKLYSAGFNSGSIGLPASFVNNVESPSIFPAFTIGDEAPLGPTSSAAFTDAEGSYEGQGHLTWIKGPHTVETGFDYLFVYFNEFRPTWPAGNFTFARDYTQGPDPTVAGTDQGWGYASFLLGLPDGGQITKDPSLAASQKNSSGFIQDDYKLTNSLTLNLGLRYDVLSGFTDRHNQFAWFDPTKPDSVLGLPGSLEFAGVNGNRRQQTLTDYGNFSPRFGFAYQIGLKTVIRGGYGLFYTTNTGGSVLGSGPQASTNVYLGPPSPAPNTPSPGGSLANPFVSGYITPPNYLVGSGVGDPFPPGTLPLLQSRNLSVQRSITGNTIVTVSYAGSRGEHLWYNLNRDAAPISALSYGSMLNQQIPNPYAGKLPGSLGAPTIAFSQTLTPFPQYTGVTWNRDPVGDSYFDALTVQVQHRDTHGLFVQLSYTLSKNIDDIPERYNGRGSTIINPNDLGMTRGLAEYNRPQYIVVNYVYQLPFGPGHQVLGHGRVSRIVANWQLSGITTYGSGLPVIITAPSSTFVPGISAVANRLHNPHLPSGEQNPEHWFDTTAYGVPAPYTVGTGNRIEPDLRGPAYGEWDLGLVRRQQFGKGVSLELRLETVNAFNNRSLGTPDGGVTDGTFGQIISSGTARNAQVGARLVF